MADFVSREVAREKLRKACKMGKIVSAGFIIVGLVYAAVAAVLALGVRLPTVMANAILWLVPTATETAFSLAECCTKALLFFLIGLIGTLMFGKVTRTGEAFRLGQMRQLRFVALMLVLLGFVPSLAGNAARVALAAQLGRMSLSVIDLSANLSCIAAGLLMFVGARMLVAGARLASQEKGMATVDPAVTTPAPDYHDMPDLANTPTAIPEVPEVSDMATVRVPKVTSADTGDAGAIDVDATIAGPADEL